MVADPKFVNKEASDFRLLPDSPAVDQGMLLKEISQDFTGKPHPQRKEPDLGAYERD